MANKPGNKKKKEQREPGSAPSEGRLPALNQIAPEWEAWILAAREIERDLQREQEKSKKLAEELARIRYEKEVLFDQLEEKDKELQARSEHYRERYEELARALHVEILDVKETLNQKATQALPPPPPRQAERAPRPSRLMDPAEIVAEKVRFRQIAAALYQEVEYLRQVYPLEAMLSAKEAELNRVKRGFQALSPQHPDRKTIEAIVKHHIAERDHLRELVEASKRRLDEQSDRINEMTVELADGAATDPDLLPSQGAEGMNLLGGLDLMSRHLNLPDC